MSVQFAPNNNTVGKLLFTGRTKDLDEIFNYLLEGRCVALYGERRGGKTLTLVTLHAVINGDINKYQQDLTDHTLRAAITGWQASLTKYTAIFVSIQGPREEAALLNRMLDECRKVGLVPPAPAPTPAPPAKHHGGAAKPQPPAPTPPANIEALLKDLQAKLAQTDRKLVILMDEMEALVEYPEGVGGALAELFANRVSYPDIYYVHAGSYKWLERVYTPGSNFTHLEAKYLSEITKDDLVNFLLNPLSEMSVKNLIATLVGGKPFYAQYLGLAAAGKKPLTEEELLENGAYASLREQIDRNIYKENGLDADSKKILAALAHHPRVSKRWLARRLNLSEVDVSNKLFKLVEFGTVYRTQSWFEQAVGWVKQRLGRGTPPAPHGSRFAIVGKFIERYGKEKIDDPTRTYYPMYLRLLLRFAGAAGLVALGIFLYFYTHPDPERKRFPIKDGEVELEIPPSLEDAEQGDMQVTFINSGAQNIEQLKLFFDSDHIVYVYNKDGSNVVPFANVEAHKKKMETLSYRVPPGPEKTMTSRFSAPDQPTNEFVIKRRLVPLKRYVVILSPLLTLVGLILPWKDWGLLSGALGKLTGGGESKPKADAETKKEEE